MDLGNTGNTIAQIGVAAVGAYFGAYTGIGAYTGMQIGLSVGSLLFQAKEAKQHIPFNESLKGTNSYVKPDPVPLVIGTDICPGNVIWVNEDTMGMVRPSFYKNPALNDWLNNIHPDASEAVKLFHIEFMASFADGLHRNNRVWLNDIHFWAWHRFDDWIHYYHNWVSSEFGIGTWTPITDMQKTQPWTPWHELYYLDRTHCKTVTPLYWWGAMMIPTPTPMDVDTLETFDRFSGKDNDYGKALALIHQGPPQAFPSLKAEISNISQTSNGDRTIPPYDGYIGDRNHVGYDHTFRDNNSHYLYGIFATTVANGISSIYQNEPWYNKHILIRRLNFYKYTYTLLEDYIYVWNNITKGFHDSQSISRQDIDSNPDHLYIFHGRNWYNGGTYNHHHALYSLEYDIFYIDRSDDTVHSICLESQLSVVGDDEDSTPRPRIQIRSMEIAGDSILLFGQEQSSHSIWEDQRTLTADAEYLPNKRTKLYADFSTYPDDYWVDDTGGVYVWAYFSYNSYDGKTILSRNSRERYRIVEQRSTYIIVDGWYALPPRTGNTLYITRIREFQAGWGIVGEGSTKTTIIVNVPSVFSPNITIGNAHYNEVAFENGQFDGFNPPWGWIIASKDNTSVTLAKPLSNTPVPGEKIWFSFRHSTNLYPQNDRYEKFTNPYNWWFWRALLPFFDWDNQYFQYENQKYVNTGLDNKQGWGKNVILKLNKHTGEFQEKIYESYFKSYRWSGLLFICVAEAIQISTISTDAQIAVSFQIAQPYSYLNNNVFTINKANLTFNSGWHGYHSYFDGEVSNGSHAAGKVFRGCVKVRAWDDYNSEYSYRWYALVAEFSPQLGYLPRHFGYDNENIGYYLLDLGEQGIFPSMDEPLTPTDSEEYSSLLNLDANESGMIKWFRPQLTTGTLYSPFFVDQSSRRDSQSLRMYDYDEKLFFVMDRGASAGQRVDVWCYHMPNEYNKYGFSWPVSQRTNDIVRRWSTGQVTDWGSLVLSCKYYLGFHGSYLFHHFSNFCDCYLSTTISKLFQQVPNKFNKPTVQSASSVYANALIEDKVLYAGKEHEIFEPRFMFSMCWSQKKPLVDMLQEVLATCQGMYVTQCQSGYSGYVKLPMPNEVPDWYFGHEEANFTSNANSSYQNIIYIDLSDYPDDYWRGDFGTITRSGVSYNFTVKKQYIDYIELETNLSIVPQINDSILIIKDNMTESSFAFSKKPQYERANKIRIEFINRLMEYKIDIAEADDIYKQEILDKRIITKQIELHGIKRATQAARMAYRYLDYEQYVNWMCSFQTDIMGHYICYGDIIGITHPVTGWFAKPFRVLRKEELDDFNVILECEEYVGSIYHDASNPVYQGTGGGSVGPTPPISDIPDPVRRLEAFYDPMTNTIYVTYSAPRNSSFFVGADIFYSVDGGEYIRAGFSSNPVASVIYSSTGTTETSSLEPTRTKYGEMEDADYKYMEIPYDPLTMIGTFPASGYLWINNELIYYGAIDTVNNKFTHVIRGLDVPEYQYAADAPDDGYNWTNPLIVLADPSNTFGFQFDTSLVDLTDEALQTEGSQIEYYIPTITIRADSLNIMGLSGFTTMSPTYSFQLRYPMGRPYSPTLLRHSRAL